MNIDVPSNSEANFQKRMLPLSTISGSMTVSGTSNALAGFIFLIAEALPLAVRIKAGNGSSSPTQD
jgi:hypothetical protein